MAETNKEPVLRIERLEIRYGDFLAVQSASLSVREGTLVALLGSNGAGKSSLLEAVAGLHAPSGGRVFFQGREITGQSPEKNLSLGLCLVPQGGKVFPRMSVEDNLLMGSYVKEARKREKESLRYVYSLFPVLEEKRKDLCGTLSGGQRQMVAIGRAFMARPKCLLFDEISLGLAPVVMKDIYGAIRRINKEEGASVLLVEQDTSRVMSFVDECHVMQKGQIVLSGPAREMTMERLKEAYLG